MNNGPLSFLLAAVLLLTLAAQPATAAAKPGKNFILTAADFTDQGPIPVALARPLAGGRNLSPALRWENAPAGTKSFALICVDLHPVARRWVHWLVINIPAAITSLPRNASGRAMPAGCRELRNSFGDYGWGGPQPPPGTGSHRYVFSLYALNTEKINADIASESQLLAAIEGKVLGVARLTGFFGR
ncbi:MAG: YbhB/YbcL family Raf kinase inhibitor-like protein [Deltaproteobacteria bacterium]|nr:YbhB/YbcL family Raf kinase inhibitor-like protein [Deltaproteobacteria bacterium]